MRLKRFFHLVKQTGDLPSATLFGLIAAVACWLLCLPFCRPVQQATLLRFHLDSPTFIGWAGLQVVPPMYNLENRYWFRNERPLGTNQIVLTESKMVNHFPARVVTFFDNRYRLFDQTSQSELVIESRFQNQVLLTKWKVVADENKTLTLIRDQGGQQR